MPLLHSEYSLDLDGSDDYVSIGDVAALQFEGTDAFSVSAWVKTSSVLAVNILGKQEASGNFRGYRLGLSGGGKLFFEAVSTPSSRIQVETSESYNYRDGLWHHMCVTYSGSSLSSGVTLYIDGKAQPVTILDDTLGANTILTTAGVSLGSRNSSTSGLAFGGRLDDIAVYNKELSAAEIAVVHNGGTPDDLTTTANLVGYWRLGDGDTFPTITDHSPSGNDGAMTNMAADDIVVDAPRPREAYYSYLFGGVDETVAIGNVAELSFDVNTPHSFSCWFKSTATGTAVLMGKQDEVGGQRRGYIFYLNAGAIAIYHRHNTSGAEMYTDTDATYNDGEWHHVVATLDGSGTAAGVTFYVDRFLSPSTPLVDNLAGQTIVTTASAHIGSKSGLSDFGRVSVTSFSVWDVELTSSQVLDLYGDGAPRDPRTIGRIPNLIGYWPLDDKAAFPTAPDLSLSGNNGTATNMEASDVKLDAPGVNFISPSVSTTSCDWGGNSSIIGWVDLGTPSQLAFERTQPFSLSLWVKFTNGGTLIGNLTNDATFRGWELYIDPAFGDFNFYLASDDGAGNLLYLYTDFGYDDGEWHHVCAVYQGDSDPNTVVIYVDGVSVPFTVDTNNLTATIVSAENVKLGKTASESSSYDGSMDEVSVYNKALSEVEVRTIYSTRRPSNILETMPVGNLVGYWKMGDGDTFPVITDHGPFGLDGEMSGYLHTHRIVNDRPPLAPSTQYALGNGGRYDATDSRLDFGKADPFSLSLWFRTDATNTTFPTLVSHQTPVGYVIEMQGNVGENPGGVMFRLIGPTDETRVSTDTAYNDGVWRHLVVTYDGGGVGSSISFYIDGALVASTIHEDTLEAEDFFAATPYRIYDAVIAGQGTIGSTCQHAAYDKELSLAEVQAIYGSGTPPDLTSVGPTANLVAWWPILDTDLPNLPNLDDAGPNDITMVSFTTAETIVSEAPAPLKSSYSIDFDGVDDVVQIPNNPQLDFERTEPFTVMVWARRNPGVSGTLVGNRDVSNSFQGWELTWSDVSGLIFTLDGNSTRLDVASGGGSFTDDTWYHFAATYDGSSAAAGVRLYIDGVEAATSVVNDSLTTSTVSVANVFIGAREDGTSAFAGRIDEVAIYDRVLAPSEVIENATPKPRDHGAVGPVDSLVGWWRMGDPGGPSVYPTIADFSVQTNNPGTMTNMVSGDIVLDSPTSLTHITLAYGSYVMGVVGPGIRPVGTNTVLAYGGSPDYLEPGGPIRSYKMRGLADPGPGYVTWIATSVPDFAAGEAPSAVQPGTTVLASDWSPDEVIQQTATPNLERLETFTSPSTVPAHGGTTFVNVDTSQGTWSDLDTITLQAAPERGDEVIIKNTGLPFKRITVDGNGNTIDGQATRVMSNSLEALHLVFSGTSWSII